LLKKTCMHQQIGGRASLFTDKKITFQGSVWILLASSTWCGDTCCQQISNDANKLFFFLFIPFSLFLNFNTYRFKISTSSFNLSFIRIWFMVFQILFVLFYIIYQGWNFFSILSPLFFYSHRHGLQFFIDIVLFFINF
jgi:hypothetical protein